MRTDTAPTQLRRRTCLRAVLEISVVATVTAALLAACTAAPELAATPPPTALPVPTPTRAVPVAPAAASAVPAVPTVSPPQVATACPGHVGCRTRSHAPAAYADSGLDAGGPPGTIGRGDADTRGAVDHLLQRQPQGRGPRPGTHPHLGGPGAASPRSAPPSPAARSLSAGR